MKALVSIVLLGSLNLAASTSEVVWSNPACQTGPCELKGARFFLTKVNDRRHRVAGNSVVAELETTSKESLKDFAFVQYLRGCHFARQGAEVRMGVREFFGRGGQPFLHRDWEIDSAWDADPIYSSYTDAGFDALRERELPRNASYYNANPLTSRNYDWWSGSVSKITVSRLYVSDQPTPSSWDPPQFGVVSAIITSLEFRLCVHRVSDIPATVDDPRTLVPNPLHCYEWSSNYQQNFTNTGLVEASTIAPECGI